MPSPMTERMRELEGIVAPRNTLLTTDLTTDLATDLTTDVESDPDAPECADNARELSHLRAQLRPAAIDLRIA
jgi:hypothetical protein